MGSTFWLAILGSAAVGVVVSTVITLIGQFWERRARRKELLLSKAIELAIRRTDIGMRLADKTGKLVILPDDAMLAAGYYNDLKHLLDKGDLPAEAKLVAEASHKKAVEALRRSKSHRGREAGRAEPR